MAIDDLFVLTMVLPTSGELSHYLTVRQQAAGLRGAMLYDELDHLGAHISENRFDEQRWLICVDDEYRDRHAFCCICSQKSQGAKK